MVIANPIYDVVFKQLMENNKVAKFFIGTLLEQNIGSVEVIIKNEIENAVNAVNAMFAEKERKYLKQLEEEKKELMQKDKVLE
jgi:hypothetical protein